MYYLKIEAWWIDFQQNQRIFLSSKESTLAAEPTALRIHCIPGLLSIPWVKATGSEGDRSPLSSVEIKKERIYTFIHLSIVMSCTGKYVSYFYLP
jgi:hypothetical protein